ncbi:unnamed protein product [Prorocentrum cordatum]|uniref:RRM domain-containing protein n=1 Tax=Prorocentrum cordatum TaxID=2364126 RepID=A0ABN9Y2A3_9DINO|nr:unnamed protein product [Polarella glacialis]
MDSTEGFPVFVGDLPQDITEEELRTVFKTYGEVKRIKVLTDADRRPVGNAVVFYGSKKGAEDAITVLHKAYKIREGATKPIRVSWAVRGKANNQPDSQRTERAPSPEAPRDRAPARRSPPRTARLERRPEPPPRSRSRGGRADSRARAREGRPRQALAAAAAGPARPSTSHGQTTTGEGAAKTRAARAGAVATTSGRTTGTRQAGGAAGAAAAGARPGAWANPGKGKGKGKREADDEDEGPPRWGKGNKGRGKGRWQGGNGAAETGGGNTRLHVERLPRDISEGALKKGFGAFGEVLGVKVLPSRGGPAATFSLPSPRGTTAAILRFATAGGAESALSAARSGYEFRPGDGQRISAKYARPNPQWD